MGRAVRTFVVDRLHGLDTRAGRNGEDNAALVTASNVSLASGWAIKRRPAMRVHTVVGSESCGLYQRGGRLRAVVPGGQSLQTTAPPEVTYDPIGGGVAYPLGVLDRLIATESYGSHPLFGPNGYLAVRRSNGQVEHHWIKAPPQSDATAVSTLVPLPFLAGSSLLKLAEKIWAPSPVEGTIRFSSSAFGPDNWIEEADAGFLAVQNHVSGARDLVATTHFRGRLAALFADAVQIWNVDPDPELHAIEQVLNGPGAVLPGAVCNVLGDVIFLSRGGFRTLSSATITGEAAEDDIGSKIRSLTDGLGTDTPAVALWSQTRSQFLCAIGTTMFAWTYIPGEKMAEWTTWTLPTALEYLVELDGVLYARSNDTVYRFEEGVAADYDGVAVASSIVTRPLVLKAPGKTKTLQYLTIRQTAAARWSVIVDGVELPSRLVPACSPKSLRIPIAGEGRQIAFKISATTDWSLEGLSIEYEVQRQ